ncbi:sensor histidine kinase [Niveibacterium terrae]|uniref:sensor histidine kinase n=1 Tax=Niveibacterium terrae TaxID=3373598 RepID=UPI003A90BACA
MAFFRRSSDAVALRSLLLNGVGLIALLFGGCALSVLIFWFVPRIESIVSERNLAVARALGTQTSYYLAQARQTVEVLAGELQRDQQGSRNLDVQVRAGSTFSAIYVVDETDHIREIGIRRGRVSDLLGLDVARNPVVLQARRSKSLSWSSVYLSPVSGQLTVALAQFAGKQIVIGEINLQQLSSFVKATAGDSSIQMVVLDANGQIIAHRDPEISLQQLSIQTLLGPDDDWRMEPRALDFMGQALLTHFLPIPQSGWRIMVGQPASQVRGPVVMLSLTLVISGALVYLLFLLVWRRFSLKLAARFEALAGLAKEVAAGKHPEVWPDFPILELRLLGQSLRHMSEAVRERELKLAELNQSLESRVVQRTTELEQANRELSEALAHLNTARHELVQTEKLAALGGIVAGVAHELNTPIGNARLAADSFVNAAREVEAARVRGLKRSDLDRFLEAGREASLQVERNLERAASLIVNFKQMAVDQATSQRRVFSLQEVVHSVVISVEPSLRKLRCRISLSDELQGRTCLLDSYPGPLGQVLTNLFMNAAVHAYPETGGEIRVSLTGDGDDRVRITVCDEGTGIAEENLNRIFEPFFTTRLGQGGSGLGLYLCYQIVTERLGGDITAQSSAGAGSCFCVRIPRNAPPASAAEQDELDAFDTLEAPPPVRGREA